MANLQQAWREGLAGRPGWRLKFSFDQGAVDAIKERVPYRDGIGQSRSYDEQKDKTWWVATDFIDRLTDVFPGLEAHLRQLPLL